MVSPSNHEVERVEAGLSQMARLAPVHLAPPGRGRRAAPGEGCDASTSVMSWHRAPHPSSAKSLSLLAALPSPLRGEGTMEPYAVETHDWQQPSR